MNMNAETRHYEEEIQDLLDNRLGAEDRVVVESHLAGCARCRSVFEALLWTRQFAAARYASGQAPAALRGEVLRALDREESPALEAPDSVLGWQARRPIIAYVFMLFVAVLFVLNYFIRFPQLPLEVAKDFRLYRSERLSLDFRTPDVQAMEQYFRDHGVSFETRVFDLGMMNYRLVGGRVHRLVNRKSALFVYHGERDKFLICQMYPGKIAELPPPSEVREHNGIQFHIYRQDGLTLAFWPEGEITCVLVSDVNPEEVIQLAFGKAIKI
ncbi:MAG: zf-HC2 domain-containing protein [Acidobacteriota bacterium]